MSIFGIPQYENKQDKSLKNEKVSQYMRFWYVFHHRALKGLTSLAYTQSHQSLHSSHTQSMEADEVLDQTLDT